MLPNSSSMIKVSCDSGAGINDCVVRNNIADFLPYAPLELRSYWGCGQVFTYVTVSEKSSISLR